MSFIQADAWPMANSKGGCFGNPCDSTMIHIDKSNKTLAQNYVSFVYNVIGLVMVLLLKVSRSFFYSYKCMTYLLFGSLCAVDIVNVKSSKEKKKCTVDQLKVPKLSDWK